MNRQTLTAVHDYFASIQEISPEEEFLLESLTQELSYFPITAVSRDDLQQRGFDTEKITDAEMEKLASLMEESYVENTYWDDLDEFASDLSLPMRSDLVSCPECDSCDTDHEPSSETFTCHTCEHTWEVKPENQN